jgi:hypothetical protein
MDAHFNQASFAGLAEGDADVIQNEGGSDDRPSPKGQFEVTDISENPIYQYDPALNLKNVKVKEKLEIPPGQTTWWVWSGSASRPNVTVSMVRLSRKRLARPLHMAASD